MYYVKVGDIMETTGERIKRYREASGMTQEELAAKIKTSPQNIYKYEKGIIHNIPMKRIQALSEVFGIAPAQLAGWGSDPCGKLNSPVQKNNPIKPLEAPDLSEDEKTLIVLYRQASPDYQTALLNLLKAGQRSEDGTKREPERVIKPSGTLKLASTMPPYRFRDENSDE